jgi:hypothetical protein
VILLVVHGSFVRQSSTVHLVIVSSRFSRLFATSVHAAAFGEVRVTLIACSARPSPLHAAVRHIATLMLERFHDQIDFLLVGAAMCTSGRQSRLLPLAGFVPAAAVDCASGRRDRPALAPPPLKRVVSGASVPEGACSVRTRRTVQSSRLVASNVMKLGYGEVRRTNV